VVVLLTKLTHLLRFFNVAIVPAGTLDEDPNIRPQQNIYWQSRACWFENPENLKIFDELPTRENK